ncbi:hypothetical protein SAMN00017405_0529 [Desulfonispora thiosulfatigenes DSM 11270]|uniref:Uncharacterized protein n=1 Tax=Desulfonispora thiosulfatigenes DSM 11270 TaxID=656914 RepID=A0A1W1V6J5_DESTI|nr:hypothetical protein [Desulfonispora thiosulfatigenes]SMB88800.1 hypothetical protein SAMN00017405_0529 [Desulfonispora thiosulfatigenes DSM 11270]
MILPLNRADEKLKETETFIKEVDEILNKLELPDFAKEIQLNSLNRRAEKMKKECEKVQRTSESEELILTLHPKDLPSGQISVRSLTTILGGFQDLSDSIANTLYNQPSEKGKIPQDILEFNEMIFKEARTGSFIAVLDLKHTSKNLIDEPVQSQTLAELFKLLSSSDGEESLSESISFLGPRALRKYSEWTKSIKDLDTTVELAWTSSYKGYSKVAINPEKAWNIYKRLSDFSQSSEEEIILTGRLMGANVRTKTFEISDENGEKITGRISKDALSEVASFVLDKPCNATLLKVITKSSSREKISWTLKSIVENEEEI